jgi:hypothetical protein
MFLGDDLTLAKTSQFEQVVKFLLRLVEVADGDYL